jgi:endonuclease YncB( thermonuclease family)
MDGKGAASVPEKLVKEYAKKGMKELGDGQVSAPVKDFVKVRLLGIDAPEIESCYADEAKQRLEELLVSSTFITQKDEEPMDDNERLLRHVFVTNDDPRDGMRNVSEDLLRGGYGFARLDTRNSQYDRRYAAAEREARAAGSGLWGACKKEVDARVASDKRLQDSSREIESAVHKPGCDIKGNISTKGAGKVYYLPKCANYHMLILDARKGEQYFCTEAEAKKAGFHKSGGCDNTF